MCVGDQSFMRCLCSHHRDARTHLRATSVPIMPSPTMPTVLPLSSTPLPYFLRSHAPPLSDAHAWGIWLQPWRMNKGK